MLLAPTNTMRQFQLFPNLLLLLVLLGGCTGGSVAEPPVAFSSTEQDSLRQAALNTPYLKALFSYCKYHTKDSLFTAAVRKDPSIRALHQVPVLEFPMQQQSKVLLEQYFNIQPYAQLPILPFWSIQDPLSSNKEQIRYFWATEPSKQVGELAVLKRFLRSSPQVVQENSKASLHLGLYFPASQGEMHLQWTSYKAPFDSLTNKGVAMTKPELTLFESYVEGLVFDLKRYFDLLHHLKKQPNMPRTKVDIWLASILQDRTYTWETYQLSASDYVPYFQQHPKQSAPSNLWKQQVVALQIQEEMRSTVTGAYLPIESRLVLHYYYK